MTRPIPIATFATRTEAEIAQGLLESAGIEASVSADDAGGAFPFALAGGVHLLVDEADAAAASDLLAGSPRRSDESGSGGT